MTKKKGPALPRYVVIKNGEWHVRRTFPSLSGERDLKGRIKYAEVTRRCDPPTAERAKEISDYLELQYKAHKAKAPETGTLAGLFKLFLAAKRQAVATRTYQDYSDLYGRYIEGTWLDSEPLTHLDARRVQQFYAQLAARGVSAKMVRKLHTLLSMAFKTAVTWRELDFNPCSGVILPKAQRTETEPMSHDQAARLMAVCRENVEFTILQLGIETGLRPQELIALRRHDVDLKNRRVHVRKAMASDLKGGGFELKDPKTQSSIRSVSFSAELAERLAEHIANLNDEWRKRHELLDASPLSRKKVKGANYYKRLRTRRAVRKRIHEYEKLDLLFPSPKGCPWSLKNLNNRLFRKALTLAADVPFAVFYDNISG